MLLPNALASTESGPCFRISRKDVDGQLICVRIIDRHELHTGIHQGRYERQVTG